MITSFSNPKVKMIRELLERARERRAAGAFIIEGIRMFRETPEKMLRETFVSESFHKDNPDVDGEVLSDSVFSRISDTKTPQGVMAVVTQPEYSFSDIVGGEKGLYLVLEGIQDPGNLGTMLRTGEAAGVKGIIMDRKTADIFSPKVVRSTMGAIYRVPFLYTEDLPGTLEKMKADGICIYAACLEGDENYHETEYSDKTAFLIGNEGNGLSRSIIEMSDKKIRIPMKGETESLNAAVSASILMYRYATTKGE